MNDYCLCADFVVETVFTDSSCTAGNELSTIHISKGWTTVNSADSDLTIEAVFECRTNLTQLPLPTGQEYAVYV